MRVQGYSLPTYSGHILDRTHPGFAVILGSVFSYDVAHFLTDHQDNLYLGGQPLPALTYIQVWRDQQGNAALKYVFGHRPQPYDIAEIPGGEEILQRHHKISGGATVGTVSQGSGSRRKGKGGAQKEDPQEESSAQGAARGGGG